MGMQDHLEQNDLCDLRSDTVTRPSAPMRAAMAEAPVGDDQFGEDPTVNRMQERIATLLGKEAARSYPGSLSERPSSRLRDWNCHSAASKA